MSTLRKVFSRIKHEGILIFDNIFGLGFQRFFWTFHGGFDLDVSLKEPHRSYLVKKIDKFLKIKSVLEVGCSTGANLIFLAESHKEIQLYGCDISSTAIRQAKKESDARAIDIKLSVGTTNNLKYFDDKSIDVVFSSATLIYVPPKFIIHSLTEMVRVAKKGVILNEFNFFERSVKEKYFFRTSSYWVYDFAILLREHPDVKAIIVERMQPGLINDNNWNSYGSFIEILL